MALTLSDILAGKIATIATPSTPKPRSSETRVDRNNNPIAVIEASTFTNPLKAAGIPYERGDPFKDEQGNTMYTLKFPDPETGILGTRAILASSSDAWKWYTKHTGKEASQKFGVTTPQQFAQLPEEHQTAIVQSIAQHESTRKPEFTNAPQPKTLSDITAAAGMTIPSMEGTPPGSDSEVQSGAAPESAYEGAKPFSQQPIGILSALGLGALKGINPIPAAERIAQTLSLGTVTPADIERQVIQPTSKALGITEQLQPAQAAATEHPYLAGGAELLTSLLGPAGMVGKATRGVTAAAKAPKLVQAMVEAAGFSGATKAQEPDSTLSDIGTSLGVGALVPPVTTAVGKGISWGAGKALNYALSSRIGQDVIDRFGPSISRHSLEAKNAWDKIITANKIQEFVGKNPVPVDLKDVVTPTYLKGLVPKFQEWNQPELAQKMSNWSDTIKKFGQLPGDEANELKSVLWQLSKFTQAGEAGRSATSDAAFKTGVSIKNRLEGVYGPELKALNQRYGSGAKLEDAIQRLDRLKPTGWDKASKLLLGGGIVGAAMTNPAAGAGLGLAAALGTVPGATALGKVGQQIAENPSIADILGVGLQKLIK